MTSSSSGSAGEYWFVLQREALALEESLQNGMLEGLTIARVDQYARQITLEMSKNTTTSSDNHSTETLMGLNREGGMRGGIRVGSSGGVGTSASIGINQSQSSSSQQLPSPQDLALYVVSLIISFPPRFPSHGLPSFTIRGADMGTAAAALSAELSAVTTGTSADVTTGGSRSSSSSLLQSSSSSSSSSSSGASGMGNVIGSVQLGFLTAIARCFRNRVLQIWSHRELTYASIHAMQHTESTPYSPLPPNTHPTTTMTVSEAPTTATTIIPLLDVHVSDGPAPGLAQGSLGQTNDDLSLRQQRERNGYEMDGFRSSDDLRTEAGTLSGGVAMTEIIDPLAYRIPCPASSGDTPFDPPETTHPLIDTKVTFYCLNY